MILRFALIHQSFWIKTKITKSLWIKFLQYHILGKTSDQSMIITSFVGKRKQIPRGQQLLFQMECLLMMT